MRRMKTITPMRSWMSAATIDEQELLAKRAATTRGHLYQLAGGHRQTSAALAGELERVTAEIARLAHAAPDTTTIILSLEESADLDSTAVDCLVELHQRLAATGQSLYIARAKTTVRLLLAQWDPQGLGQPQRMFWSVADAVEFAQNAKHPPV